MSEPTPWPVTTEGPAPRSVVEGRSPDRAALDVRIERFAESLRISCDACAHSRFIHSDDGSRCLYSECACVGFARDPSPDRVEDEPTGGGLL